jgi:cation diffusion facilitator family transporter
VSGTDEAYRTARRLTAAGIAVSAVLAAASTSVGLASQSTSVVAVGIEFAGDVLASLVVLVGLRVAARPADDNHPYGHGRVEILSAFVVGIALAAAGAAIVYRSLQAVGASHPPPGMWAELVLVAAIALRGVMSVVKFRAGRRLRSAALVADAWNDTVDILAAVAALTAVALANHDPDRFLAADHYGGFLIGIVVIVLGIRVGRDASLELMDTMPPAELVADVRRVAAGVPGVMAVEKLFARKTGLQYHVDLHIEVDSMLTVAASHEIAATVRSVLQRDCPWVADVLVHVEPAHPQADRKP